MTEPSALAPASWSGMIQEGTASWAKADETSDVKAIARLTVLRTKTSPEDFGVSLDCSLSGDNAAAPGGRVAPQRGRKRSWKVFCHFFSSSAVKVTGTILWLVRRVIASGGLGATSGRTGKRPALRENSCA